MHTEKWMTMTMKKEEMYCCPLERTTGRREMWRCTRLPQKYLTHMVLLHDSDACPAIISSHVDAEAWSTGRSMATNAPPTRGGMHTQESSSARCRWSFIPFSSTFISKYVFFYLELHGLLCGNRSNESCTYYNFVGFYLKCLCYVHLKKITPSISTQ